MVSRMNIPHTKLPPALSRMQPFSWHCASLRGLALTRLPPSFQQSSIGGAYLRPSSSICLRSNWLSSSNTRFLCGLSSHSTTSSMWSSFASSRLHCLDSPYFRWVQYCCQHRLCASDSALVDRLHCMPIHLDLHIHGAYLPLCTTSCCQCAYPRGSPLQGALIVSQKRKAYSPLYILSPKML